ncbi:MAG: sugar ABC transporter ATP-binding protein [Spirochaetaceae bacterium]|jgi:ribose transport system ATP-binding protein|nr:sugar ABC transporter ATP-binding protein [Spirochaetaceae bacterium]
MTDLLEMKGIRKQFSGTQVLFDVDFNLNRGELHALVGENGAGKSTLIKILAGIYQADAGQITFEGKAVKFKSPKDAIFAGISTIHQEFNLVDNLDVAANVFLGREKITAGLIRNKNIYEQTRGLLQRVDSNFDVKERVKNLGVAEKQLVEICKALSVNSRIVVMDEPTAVLSAKEINKFFEVIMGLKKEGLAIIYISHRLEELPHIADRVSILRDGKMVGELKTKEFAKDAITRMMIGRDLVEQFPSVAKTINETILRVDSLSCDKIIRNISFEVKKGEILGISGLVGSGRTELARAIIGINRISAGKIYLNNKHVIIDSPIKAKKLGIVMIPEERKSEGLILSLDIENNISLPYLDMMSYFLLVSNRKTAGNGNEIIHKLAIKPDRLNVKTRNLSGGNQQKVVIGKWIYKNHQVLIFDEPTRGVDVGAKAEIYKIISELAKSGAAIIMISSDLPEIIGMSDRVIVMRRGELAGELQRHELEEHAIMKLAF